MPGSTALFQSDQDDEEGKDSESRLTSNRQPPPVVPRPTSVTLQTWQSVTSAQENYGDNKHARSASMDSLESSGSSSSGGGSSISSHRIIESGVGEYIPTRVSGKVPKIPSHNPLQFVKVQSPLYKKAELQIKLTKDVKISREAVKEGEEEWQSNLDNWKSRRRKVTEKVIQRAEEIRQIEAEEQLRHEQCLLQQRKIKKFSEIVERRSSRSYNLDLYIGQGDDSGLGGTPEPDDVIDSHNSILRSDTSEGMTSEAESIDSDSHKSDKTQDKETPIIPQKPQLWQKRNILINTNHQSPPHSYLSEIADKELHSFDNISSTEPSDIEGHVGDSETISSEEDICFGDNSKVESDPENTDSCTLTNNELLNELDFHVEQESPNSHLNSNVKVEFKRKDPISNTETENYRIHSFKIGIKPGDNKGFGFTVKGGKDLGCIPYIDTVVLDGPAGLVGVKEGDEIISLNGELASTYSHASLLFTIKQAVYMGILDIEISRSFAHDLNEFKAKSANKKSSFAEKLAIFNSGTNLDKTKTSPTFSKPDVKKESLVLRRRSAFETNNSENVLHRRSSCLSREISVEDQNVEKRHSVDFSQSQVKKNNSITKKDPPPPVPAKPKLKQIFKSEMTNIEKCDNVTQINICSGISNSQCVDSVNNSATDKLLDNTCVVLSNVLKLDKTEFEKEHDVSDLNYFNNEHKGLQDDSIQNTHSLDSISQITVIDTGAINNSSEYLIDETNVNTSSSALSNNNISLTDPLLNSDIKILNLQSNEILTEYKIEDTASFCQALEIVPLDECYDRINDCIIQDTKPSSEEMVVCDVKESSSENYDEIVQFESEIHASACNEIVNVNNVKPVELMSDIVQEINNFENLDESVTMTINNDQSEDVDNVENFEEDATAVHPSPLCLSLEKTDEDDVISASTTTSSETPDTETVIETLPLNLSPLPNDESNGEDSSKIQNSHDQQIETESCEIVQKVETSSILNIDEINSPNEILLEQSELDEKPFNQDNCDINNLSAANDDVFIEDQDEEYRLELDESLDQITALDVIDEIEHKLMQQLENQDENFEDIGENLILQLENDINQEWIYYSDADLLDDYTPQNREPPREPPPPPPIESEISEEVLPPLTRINSTKRLKKELWRRRSDFLGLNSTEGIDVDNIIPPPPGLEEILKLEREQDQWLEKRLSLAETDVSDSSLIKSFDSQDLGQADYSSYLPADEGDDSKLEFETSIDNWQDNMEENTLETGDSLNIPELPTHILEENTKVKESPQHKAKQSIQNLGAAPKAKIMDSNKWITEKVIPSNKKSTEPVFRQASYDQNFWITQDAGRKRNSDIPNRRYSLTSQTSSHPDVTLRTWDDRENEFQKQRPRSTMWNSPSNSGASYGSESPFKQNILHTPDFDDEDEIRCDTDVLESEVHQCSCCGKGLCEGSAMGIEALRLYFHIECFRCCMCQMLLGNGMCGTDVQVKNNQLYCPNCFTVD